jgi:alkanesulfonate monooxygenase SsuD/methylene tetrahydromethanopterin reductase-like flavin-dependent oxidoreductase (luciferase family)
VRFADEYNTTYATPDECRERRARLTAACEDIARDPASMTFSIMTALVVGSDRTELLERAHRVMQRTLAIGDPSGWLLEKASEGWIVGLVDDVREQLRALADAGVERFFLQHLDHTDLETVELVGAELNR